MLEYTNVQNHQNSIAMLIYNSLIERKVVDSLLHILEGSEETGVGDAGPNKSHSESAPGSALHKLNWWVFGCAGMMAQAVPLIPSLDCIEGIAL
jgi:hypothetical protein